MRGVGGPLLCIGDLLSDVGGGDDVGDHDLSPNLTDNPSFTPSSSSSSSVSASAPNGNLNLQSSHLPQLFQDNYEQLKEALAGSGHTWTALTIKLCTALETASKLVQSTNSRVASLSEKVGELEKVMRRGDSSVAEARAILVSLNKERNS